MRGALWLNEEAGRYQGHLEIAGRKYALYAYENEKNGDRQPALKIAIYNYKAGA